MFHDGGKLYWHRRFRSCLCESWPIMLCASTGTWCVCFNADKFCVFYPNLSISEEFQKSLITSDIRTKLLTSCPLKIFSQFQKYTNIVKTTQLRSWSGINMRLQWISLGILKNSALTQSLHCVLDYELSTERFSESIPVKRSRNVNICYDCYHAVSDGIDVGNKACGEVFNNNKPTLIKTINCTGHCMVSISAHFPSLQTELILVILG